MRALTFAGLSRRSSRKMPTARRPCCSLLAFRAARYSTFSVESLPVASLFETRVNVGPLSRILGVGPLSRRLAARAESSAAT